MIMRSAELWKSQQIEDIWWGRLQNIALQSHRLGGMHSKSYTYLSLYFEVRKRVPPETNAANLKLERSSRG
jgi:hypothetical protein